MTQGVDSEYLHVGVRCRWTLPKAASIFPPMRSFAWFRDGFASILDDRADEPGISLTDALMSAFAMFP